MLAEPLGRGPRVPFEKSPEARSRAGGVSSALMPPQRVRAESRAGRARASRPRVAARPRPHRHRRRPARASRRAPGHRDSRSPHRRRCRRRRARRLRRRSERDRGGGAGSGVLERVRQRLLDQAEDGQLRGRRERSGRPLDHQRDRQPGGAHLVQQLRHVVGARLRRTLRARALAQHPEQPAHVRQRLPAGRRRQLHRPRRLLRIVARREGGAIRERGHHREVVGDDVVHLARDPGALGSRRDLALLVALVLEPRGALLERVQVGAADLHAAAERHGRDHHAGQEDDGRERTPAAPACDRDRDAQLERGGGRERPPPRLARRDRVERHQQRQVGPHRPSRQPLGERHQRDRGEHRRRAATPRQQRQRQQRHPQPLDRPPRAAGGHVRARDREQPEREQQVDRDRMTVHQRPDVTFVAHAVEVDITRRAAGT
jgi:hypothetical protein